MQEKFSSSVRVFYPRYSRQEVIERLKKGVEKLSSLLPLKLVALFGSYGKGNYTASSDIDILVVYSGKKIEDDFKIIKKIFDIHGLEPHIFSEHELEHIPSCMIKDNIIIYKA